MEKKSKILEIGPFVWPKFSGDNVFYFDVIDAEEIKKTAISQGFTIDIAPNLIHYISNTGDLKIINNKFDYVYSAHCIEHCLDFIDHLNNVEALLNIDGIYLCIIPDYRFCFDHFQNPSTIADIIDAYYNKISTHTLKSLIEHTVLTTHNDPIRHWNNDSGDGNIDTQKAINIVNQFLETKDYINSHKWYFNPTNFIKIIAMLNEMKLVNLKIEKIYNTMINSCEFAVIFRKNSSK